MARGGAEGFGGGRPPPAPEACPEGGKGSRPGPPRGGRAPWLRGAPDPRGRSGSRRSGSCAPGPALGFLAALHAAWAAPGPRGARPGAGAAGGSPEPHVFHSALCLEPAPRRLSPWKQNRGGGGRSRVGLGPGWGEEVGLAGRRRGNGNRGAPPLHPGHGLPASTPCFPGLAPAPGLSPGLRLALLALSSFLIPSLQPLR